MARLALLLIPFVLGAAGSSQAMVESDRSSGGARTGPLERAVIGESYPGTSVAPAGKTTTALPGKFDRTDKVAPTKPGDLEVVSADSSWISLAWRKSTDRVGVAGYLVYVEGALSGTAVETSHTVTRLNCGRGYKLEVVAVDYANNRSQAAEVMAATRPCGDTSPPSAPRTLVQAAPTPTGFGVSWVASTDDVGVVGYDVFRDGVKVGSTAQTSYALTGLTCATGYVIGVEAFDAAGNRSARANAAMATASCPDTSPPSAPSGLSQTAATESSVAIKWVSASDNVGVAGYGVYRDGTLAGSSSATSYTLTGLACGTSYNVGVDAYDAAGNRSAATTATVATSACSPGRPPTDTNPPSIPGGLAQAGATETSVTLAWAPSTDDVGVAGYGLYRGGLRVDTTLSPGYTLAGLTCGTSYLVAVDAFDAAGNRSAQSSLYVSTSSCPAPPPPPPPSGDTDPPSAPTSQALSDVSETGFVMSWAASTDNVGVTGYNVYLDGARLATVTSLSYTYSGLGCGRTYVVALEARDAAGNVSDKAHATGPATTSACSEPPPPPPPPSGDTEPPSAPTSQALSGVSETGFVMSWAASTDNVGVTGYNVYLDGARLATVTSLSYTYSGLGCGRTYVVALEARDAAGNVSDRASATGPVTTSPCPGDSTPPTAPGSVRVVSAGTTSVTFSWTASSDNVGVSGYGLFRDGAQVATTSSTSYTFSALACGTSYALGVDAYDAAGNRSTRVVVTAATSPCADSQPPSAPSGLVQSAANETSATIAWQPSTDNVGVAGYGVYQGGVRVDSTTARSFTVTGLACGRTYTVAVDAYDAAGNRSAQTSLVVSTSACRADTVPPSAPTNQTISQVTQTGFLMSWAASTDNVGVTGYDVYLNGAKVTTVTTLSYLYTGLTCGTTYTVALEARDAAGNVSNRADATGNAATAACNVPPPPPPSGDAASYFVSPSGSDANPCLQAAPCASFQRAYTLALPGRVVEVAGGTYPSQTIRAVPGKTGPNVVFRPAAGSRVILGGLTFGADGDPAQGPDFITVRGMETRYKGSNPGAGNQQGIHAGPGSAYITLEDMDAGSISSWFADHLTVRGGDYGPCDAVTGANVCGNNKQDVSTNVLIEGAYFHDLEYDPSAPGAHWECMYINAGRDVTIRGNRFERCAIYDVFVTISGPDAGRMGHENLTIENNFFAPATDGNGSPSRGWTSLSLSWCQNAPQPSYRNVKIRNNSFGPGAGIEKDLNADAAGCRWQAVSVTGNILAYFGCQNGWSYANNLWVGSSKCATSDGNLTALPYVNVGALDYHLIAPSIAERFVPGTLCPATDIDGQPRNAPCAAGADER